MELMAADALKCVGMWSMSRMVRRSPQVNQVERMHEQEFRVEQYNIVL
jgi:hypothetical protein